MKSHICTFSLVEGSYGALLMTAGLLYGYNETTNRSLLFTCTATRTGSTCPHCQNPKQTGEFIHEHTGTDSSVFIGGSQINQIIFKVYILKIIIIKYECFLSENMFSQFLVNVNLLDAI